MQKVELLKEKIGSSSSNLEHFISTEDLPLEIRAFERRIMDYQVCKNTLFKEFKLLDQSMKKTSAMIKEVSDIKQKIRHQTHSENTEEIYSRVKSQIKTEWAAIEVLETKSNSLDATIDQKKTRLDSMSRSQLDMEDKMSQVHARIEELATHFKNKEDMKESILSSLSAQFDQIQMEIEDRSSQLYNSTNEFSILKEGLHESSKSLEDLKLNIRTLHIELEHMDSSISNLGRVIHEQRHTISAGAKIVDDKVVIENQLKKSIEDETSRLNSLGLWESEIESGVSIYTAQLSEEATKLEQIEEQIIKTRNAVIV